MDRRVEEHAQNARVNWEWWTLCGREPGGANVDELGAREQPLRLRQGRHPALSRRHPAGRHRAKAADEARARDAAAAAREAMFEQLREIASIVDAVNAIVYVSDLDSHELLYLNRHATELFGDCFGQRCYQALQAGQAGACAFCTNRRLVVDGKAGPPVIWEFQNTRTVRWYMCIDKAVPWLDGRLVRMEAAVDITDRKRAEETATFLAEGERGARRLARLRRDPVGGRPARGAAARRLGIVEAHGGKVWAISREGAGSTFFFTVPTSPTPGKWQGRS